MQKKMPPITKSNDVKHVMVNTTGNTEPPEGLANVSYRYTFVAMSAKNACQLTCSLPAACRKWLGLSNFPSRMP